MTETARIDLNLFIDMSNVPETHLLKLKPPYIFKYVRYYHAKDKKVIINRKKIEIDTILAQTHLQFKLAAPNRSNKVSSTHKLQIRSSLTHPYFISNNSWNC